MLLWLIHATLGKLASSEWPDVLLGVYNNLKPSQHNLDNDILACLADFKLCPAEITFPLLQLQLNCMTAPAAELLDDG